MGDPAPKHFRGIDFGSKHSVLAAAIDGGVTKIVPNSYANDQTPTLVSWQDGHRLLGDVAGPRLASAPQSALRESLPLVPWKFQEEQIVLGEHAFSPIQLAGMLLGEISHSVPLPAGPDGAPAPTRNCVLAIPSYYTAEERARVADAARVGGWSVDAVISHGLAAALTFHQSSRRKIASDQSKEEQKASPAAEVKDGEEAAKPPEVSETPKHSVLICDIGHNQFTVALYAMNDSTVELKGMHSQALGSSSIDQEIFRYAIQNAKFEISSVRAKARLLRESEKVKQILSTVPATQLAIECLQDDHDLHLEIPRAVVEQAAQPLTAALSGAIQTLLPEPIPGLVVEVTGGGARTPCIQASIQALVAVPLRFTLDASHCVALGAATYHQALAGVLPLNITDSTVHAQPAPQLSPAELETFKKVEAQLRAQDELISATSNAKNTLETLIYRHREIANSEVVQAGHRPAVLQLLSETEEWLWADERTLEELVGRLKAVEEGEAAAAPELAAHFAALEQKKAEELAKAEAARQEEAAKPHQRVIKTNPERILAARKKKDQGNLVFKDLDYPAAIKLYTEALELLQGAFDLSDDQKQQVNEIKISCFLNTTQCCIKLKEWALAVRNCDKVIEIDANNSKALFRRGQSYYYLQKYDEAKRDLVKARSLEPSDQLITKTLQAVEEMQRKETEKQKRVYAKMFSN